MADDRARISLTGSVALGTGVMIGAGIFALVGQVTALAGTLLVPAFAAGAAVAAVSSYAYARCSADQPSSGGIAMILKRAYGPGLTAGTFAMFMYVSMVVAESLLARTFGTYLLRPFGLQDSAVLVPLLGLLAIGAAVVVNLVGNRLVEGSADVTAALKIGGIVLLAGAGIAGAVGASSLAAVPQGERGDAVAVLAAVALSVLAYKGFTTITNQGEDIEDPARNIPRSIAVAIAICLVLYLLIAVAVASSLSVAEIVRARDYSLAETAEPVFGTAGVALTGAVAVVATLSGLIASLFSVSRLYAMLQDMEQAPRLPAAVPHQPLLITAGAAALATVAMDLSRIASVGVVLYLTMDIAIQWGVVRRLRGELALRPWICVLSIVLNAGVLAAFVVAKLERDVVTLVVAGGLCVVITATQWALLRRREPAVSG